MDKDLRQLAALEEELAPLGWETRGEETPYFCTPEGADILGWAGVDGIHYCRIRGFGRMLFAVSPMNAAPDYVHPIAEDVPCLVRLLLACDDMAALEQAWQWDEEMFARFLAENSPDEVRRAALAALAEKTGLAPMPDPWRYLHDLQAGFDYGRLRYGAEYYDLVGEEAPPPQEWKVYFDGSFWGHAGRDRPGRAVDVEQWFTWAGRRWYVPCVYLCGKGLVMDLCMEADAGAVRAFAEKWGLDGGDDEGRFTPEEQMRLAAENPLSFEFEPAVTVNGRGLTRSQGCSCSYAPGFPGMADEATRAVMAHYDLAEDRGWVVTRAAFPWPGKKPADITALTLTLVQEPVEVPGPRFHVHRTGEELCLARPDRGETYTLRVAGLRTETLPERFFPDSRRRYPDQCVVLEYTLSPEPEESVRIRDLGEGDRPVPREGAEAGDEPTECAAIAIIGGADGPTVLVTDGRGQCRAASSALYFRAEPGEIEWCAVFDEKRFPDLTVPLL